MLTRSVMRAQIVALCRVIRETKTAGHGVPRFSRITISRRCRHDTRYAHAFYRAKAIFRSNMIIKSNGIRNSSGARILSTNSPLFTSSHPPVARLVVCCDPLTFSPGWGKECVLPCSSFFFSLSFLFLSKHTDIGIHEWAE